MEPSKYHGIRPRPILALKQTFSRLREVWPTLPVVDRSPIMWVVVRVVLFVECLGAAAWAGPRILHQENDEDIIRRARRVDWFVLVVLMLCLALVVLCWALPRQDWLRPATAVLAFYVAMNALVTGVAIHIIHPVVVRDPVKSTTVSSVHRLIVLSFLNYFQVLLAFVSFYWARATFFNIGDALKDGSFVHPSSGWDFLYISLASQLGLGFGELYPVHSVRWVTSVQCLTGFLLSIVILSRVLGLLRGLKSRFGAEGDAK